MFNLHWRNKKNKNLQKHTTVMKTFEYHKGNSDLRFNICIDDKKLVQEFKECLENALKDVSEELEKSN